MSAMVWVGGQLTISVLLLPIVRDRLTGTDRADVMRQIGRRFGSFTITVFLPVQIATGILLTWRAASRSIRWAIPVTAGRCWPSSSCSPW